MGDRTNKEQKPPEKKMTPEELEAMMIQLQKDATLPSLLYVTRKLGEVEGMISQQTHPDETLVGVREDLNSLYGKIVEEAGIELLPESGRVGGIGGDRG
jgi:hypothetical protein